MLPQQLDGLVLVHPDAGESFYVKFFIITRCLDKRLPLVQEEFDSEPEVDRVDFEENLVVVLERLVDDVLLCELSLLVLF